MTFGPPIIADGLALNPRELELLLVVYRRGTFDMVDDDVLWGVEHRLIRRGHLRHVKTRGQPKPTKVRLTETGRARVLRALGKVDLRGLLGRRAQTP